MNIDWDIARTVHPTRAYNKARSGRASRRQGMHKKQNQPWYGPLSTLQRPCPTCWTIHKWNTGCSE